MELINDNQEWEIRDAIGEDLPFIYSSWCKSMHVGSSLGKICKQSIFFFEYAKVIDSILSQTDTKVRVACSKDDPKVFFGYIVYELKTLHYVYTKIDFRQFSISEQLINQLGPFEFYTNETSLIKKLLNNKSTYNPFILFKQGDVSGEGSKV